MYGWVIRHFEHKSFATVARLRRAHSLIQLGDSNELPEAKTLLEEYLSSEGEGMARDEALYQLGWVHLELGDQAQGTAIFDRLVSEHPNSKYRLDAALRTAQNYVAQSQLDKAMQKLNELSPDAALPTPIRTRKLFLVGEIAARRGDWNSVADSMNHLLRELDDEASKVKATYWLAEASFRKSNFEDSAQQFQFVREHYRELSADLHPWIWLRLAQSLGHLEKWREARKIAEDGVMQFDSFALRYEFDFLRARGLEDLGRLSDAQQLYQQVIDSSQGCNTETAAIAQWRIGEIFFHQEDFAQAIKAYYLVDSHFAYEQWRSAALLQAGKCQENLENYAHAEKLYSRLIEQFPTSIHRQSADERIRRLKQFQPAKFNSSKSKSDAITKETQKTNK
jgi:TolA-binding protein